MIFYVLISISVLCLFFWTNQKAHQDGLIFYTNNGIKSRRVNWKPEHDKLWHELIVPRAFMMFLCGGFFFTAIVWDIFKLIYFLNTEIAYHFASLTPIFIIVLYFRYLFFEWRLKYYD